MFSQFVIGPPGSGKSTYCTGMQQFMGAMGRQVAVVNLDPANDNLPYDCAVDVSELITLSDVMEEYGLGPNGGLIYCIEFLAKNLDWLKDKLAALGDVYILFDCPGQVELYTHHTGMKDLAQSLQQWNHHICVVHLVDSHHCSDPAKFLSVLMVSLSTMCHLELPHINVLSKIDLIEQFGDLPFGLEFFTDVLDLEYLMEHLESDKFAGRFTALNKALCGLIEDYNQVAFTTLNISDKHSVDSVLKLIDKANGYLFGDMEREKRSHNLLYNVDNIRGTSEPDYTRTMEVQEDYMREVAPSHRPSLPARDIVPMRIPVPVSENEGLQQPSNQPSKICWNCMRVEGTHRCTACKAAYYCSRTCQSTHWQQHKSRCKLLQNSAASAAAAGAKITLNDDNN